MLETKTELMRKFADQRFANYNRNNPENPVTEYLIVVSMKEISDRMREELDRLKEEKLKESILIVEIPENFEEILMFEEINKMQESVIHTPKRIGREIVLIGVAAHGYSFAMPSQGTFEMAIEGIKQIEEHMEIKSRMPVFTIESLPYEHYDFSAEERNRKKQIRQEQKYQQKHFNKIASKKFKTFGR